jgi:hypothetical protein
VAHVVVNGHTVDATAAATVDMLSWPGATAHRSLVHGRTVRAGSERGTRIGLVAAVLGKQREIVPVRLQQRLAMASLLQRLF